MDDEKLITLVQGYPALYHTSNSKYMDINFKNCIWSKLGLEMEMDGTACKARWNNIRDNYRKSLNKQKIQSGRQATKFKRYKYSEQMSFLKRFFEGRATKTNIEVEGNESEEVLETALKVEDESYMESEYNDVSTTQLENQTSTYPFEEQNPAAVMEYTVQTNKNLQPTTHPVDAFLAAIAPSLKKLSPLEWHYAKGEIFATVQRYELAVLNRQQAISTRSNEMCSFGQPSPTGSCQSSWDSKPSNLSTGHNEETQ